MAGDLKAHTPLIGLSDTRDTTPAELIPLIKEFGFEGIIAKRKDSCYEPGKHPAKKKPATTAAAKKKSVS
jgi:ATP-dependent DNA ligase